MGNVGGALINAPQALGINTLLSYQRGQEESADRAGVRFLTMTGQSAKGMYDTFKRFADESLFSAQGVNPYAQNHPMPEERMAALAELVKTPYWDKKDPPELQFRHDMMRAKLYGFTERPDTVLRHYPLIGHQPARPLRARHLDLPVRRPAQRHRADRRPDRSRCPTIPISTSSKARRCSKAGIRRKRSRRYAAPCSSRPIPRSSRSCWRKRWSPPTIPSRSDEAIPLLRAALLKEPEAGDAYTTAGDGLWPQERSCRRRSCLGAGRLRPRRQQDRARTRRTRQAALSDRIARLGPRRRYRCFQQEPEGQPAYK